MENETQFNHKKPTVPGFKFAQTVGLLFIILHVVNSTSVSHIDLMNLD